MNGVVVEYVECMMFSRETMGIRAQKRRHLELILLGAPRPQRFANTWTARGRDRLMDVQPRFDLLRGQHVDD